MNWRFRITLFVFLLLFLLVDGRLFYWQVVRADELSAMGQNQYGSSIQILPKRGEILTQDQTTGDTFPLVATNTDYLVFANPKEITDKDQSSKLLSDLLKVDPATVSAQLSRDKYWVPIKSYVPLDTKQVVESKHIPGVGFEEQSAPFYPEASMAAQLVGIIGKDKEGNDQGYFGLEGYYDRLLRGKIGYGQEIHDAFGVPILSKLNNKTGAVDGSSVIVHTDRAIQYLVEKNLKQGMLDYGADRAMAAVIDPKTGAILAMASYPSFDPRDFIDYPTNTYENPLISSLYEPGSTFKSIVMASALDAGAVKPDTQCDACGGPVQIGGYSIETWNNQYEDGINMIKTIQESDNTGMVFVERKLGIDKMLSYLQKFGIGQTTGIDLQGEVSEDLKPKTQWYPIDIATASFGQGISVTPIELLDAFSSIANDGKRMEPHVVSQIMSPDGQTITIPPKVLDQPISAATSKVMTEILVNAVNNGEAKFARLKGYRIAGKTGTAQIPIAGHYDPTKTIASFIGFAPADNPKFAMLVIYDRPSSSIYGSETAAPTFFSIARDLLMYYGIQPTESAN